MKRRSGAILIVVLVVMLVAGLLAAQTIQLLWMIARGDRQRSQVRQATELIDLGIAMIEQQAVPESGSLRLDVDGIPATIQFQKLSIEPSLRFRIVARYGATESVPGIATWESPDDQ